MDEGAQRSIITQKLADRLQLVRDGTDVIQLSSFGDPSNRVQHLDTATVNVVAVNGDLIPIRVLIVSVIAKPISNRYRRSVQNLPYLRGLTLAHSVTMDYTFDISLLIGMDFYWEIVGDQTVRGDGPTAMSSRIGYFLSGPLTSSSGNSSHVMDILAMYLSDTTDLTRFWELESMGISSEDNEDTDGSMYLKHYQDRSISFLDGRYTAKLPWKQDHQPLPLNYEITKKRTESTIRTLSKEPHLLQYDKIIKEQENRGFIERVDENTPASRVHYIPHHGVKRDSATTPIRIVYDCSCRQSTGSPSINDCLESTPPELNELTTLLMRRQGQYAVSADIEKAFLNVALHEDDRDVTRFLWLFDPADPDSELVAYRFRSVLFGATCSPFILSATLLKHIPEPLTPSHLLYGRRLTCLPFTEVTTPDENVQSSRDDIKRRVQRHALIIDQFRRRWKHEYFTSRLQWNLAVVDELLTGNDGFTRAARIRTSKGVTIRPIVKLYPLEIVHLPDGH